MKQKKIKIILITSISLILLIAILSVIFSLLNISNPNIISGIKIGTIEIGGLSREQALKKVTEETQKEIKLIYQEHEESISPEELKATENIEEVIEEALHIGKSGNIIKDNYEILFSFLFGKKIDLTVEVSQEKIAQKIEEIEGKLPNAYIDNNYYIENNQLVIRRGNEGIKIKAEELKQEIEKVIQEQGKKVITIPVEKVKLETIQIEKIHQEIYKEAKDAYITKDPIEVHPEVNGVDFAISLEEAKGMLKEEKEEYSIPLNITVPEKTMSQLGKEAFPQTVAEYATRYDVSNKNRSNNLELASAKIDGTVVMPGETFSYNKTVGERTIAAGYKEAAIYSGGKVVDGIGGGICQLSSTLYNTVLYANLEIVTRSNHRFLTSYVPAGRDATVSWGTIDFKFKNTRKYPIQIKSTVKNGIVTIQINGIKEEKEYEVEIESKVTQTIPYTIHTIEDDNIINGTETIEQYGAEGAKSITYKVLKLNGIEVERTILSNDTYSPLERIIRKGTKME